MNEVDETKNRNGRGATRLTRRFEISLPIASARVVEAAATLGGYDTPEEFFQEAALKAAAEFQQRLQQAISRDTSNEKGKKAGKGVSQQS